MENIVFTADKERLRFETPARFFEFLTAQMNNRRVWQITLVIFAVHAVIFVSQLPQVYLYALRNPQEGSVAIHIARVAWGTCSWALFVPFILWLGYYFRITQRHLWRNLSLHLLFSILAGGVQHVVCVCGLWAFGLITTEEFFTGFSNAWTLLNNITLSMLRYPAIVGIQQAYLYFRESQERSFRLQQAELEMLKMQLHPHFFFNTLNAISSLMYRSTKEADRMIIQLGDIFRVALRKDKAQKVSLKEELEFLEAFLQIHKTLMGNRLQIEWQIDPETLDALVPNLILQPLAENAIQHGINQLEDGGQITISALKRNGDLILRVADTGPGADADEYAAGTGIGLSNTQARLENLYQNDFKFSIEGSDGDGFAVNIIIPFEEEPGA